MPEYEEEKFQEIKDALKKRLMAAVRGVGPMTEDAATDFERLRAAQQEVDAAGKDALAALDRVFRSS